MITIEQAAAVEYGPHPYADLIPEMSGDEFADLSRDITANGLLEPVVLYEGLILDGRHRAQACAESGVSLVTTDFAGDDEAALLFVISKNLKRRHLNVGQRADVALAIEPVFAAQAKAAMAAAGASAAPGRPAEKGEADLPHVSRAPQSRDKAAAAVGVSGRAVQDLKRVKKSDAKLGEKVRSGKVALGAAVAKVKRTDDKKKRAAKAAAALELPLTEDRWRLLHRACADVSPADVADASVSFVVTDPPYPKEYLGVYSDLGALAARALRPGGSLLCMTGQSYLPDVIARLCEHMTYHWTIAYLTPGGKATQLWERKAMTFWKPVLWFVKGAYEGDWIGDVPKSDVNDNDKRFHGWGQSVSGMTDLLRPFVSPGDVIFDPFVGGGATACAALGLGCDFVGSDAAQDVLGDTSARLRGMA